MLRTSPAIAAGRIGPQQFEQRGLVAMIKATAATGMAAPFGRGEVMRKLLAARFSLPAIGEEAAP